ncbi:serine protease snake-like [Culex pipiens pallens]|uniref:serine protease snake-like n=1 Tax=Culex pipiens pallens TaxID=42434 RepID=UPI001952D500|nr:serine protease snake-like [Culex pipiens pallens]
MATRRVIPSSSRWLLVLLIAIVEGQRIAERKCNEYREEVVARKGLVALTLTSKPIYYNIYNCSKSVDLIVGGEAARKDEFPHQALLGWPSTERGRKYNFFCGGSLISERFVLTAGHCGFLMGVGKPSVVRLGENDLDDGGEDHADFDIAKFIKHPNYRYKFGYYDIALVRLVDTVLFSKQIRPACLWTGRVMNFTSGVATGFGLTGDAGDSSSTLQKVTLNFVDNRVCDWIFAGTRKLATGLNDAQLCMAAPRGERKDTCQGDSGGPVQVVTDNAGCTYHVVAITSTGGACGVENSAAVYTRVSSYVDWIEKVVWS